MIWLPILLTVIGFLVALLIIVFLVKRNKTYFIPSILLLMVSLTFISLSLTADTSGGGWQDVIYMIFGIFFIIAGVVVTFIVIMVRAYQKNKK